MHRKTAFLVCAMAALIGFKNANASAPPHADTGIFEVKSSDGNYRLGFSALLQPRLEFKHWKRDKKANELDFDLNRARFGFYGNVFDPALTFLFQAQFDHEPANTHGLKPKVLESASLTDFSINYAFSQEFFHIAAGKFTVPMARQQVMSPGKLQFGNPLNYNRHFALTLDSHDIRDIGVMFHNGWNNPLEYALAIVSNGAAARLAYNYNHIDGYDAVDLNGGDFRFAFGVSGYMKRLTKAGAPHLLSKKFNNVNASADFIIKAHGFATNGVFYYNWAKDDKEGSEAKTGMGAGIDLGYLINGTIEPVIRYGWYKPKEEQSHEILGGLNYYAFGHNLKTQLYGGVTLDTKKEINPIVAGFQLQFAL